MNKKANGKLKCENGDNIIEKVCSLRSKVYAFLYAEDYVRFLTDGDKSKLVRCKGTNKTTIKNEITFDKLLDTIKESTRTKNDNYCLTF